MTYPRASGTRGYLIPLSPRHSAQCFWCGLEESDLRNILSAGAFVKARQSSHTGLLRPRTVLWVDSDSFPGFILWARYTPFSSVQALGVNPRMDEAEDIQPGKNPLRWTDFSFVVMAVLFLLASFEHEPHMTLIIFRSLAGRAWWMLFFEKCSHLNAGCIWVHLAWVLD